MTVFKTYIKNQLENGQFVSVATLMDLALYHPEFGYYMIQNPLGDRADFVTSPEISQMFAEILCLWAMEKYLELQKPARLAILELGPGRGLLMSDFLKFAERFPDFYASLEIHLIEISPTLKNIQQTQLTHPHQFWHTDIEDAFKKIGHLPTLILANEFFDALPLEQYRLQNHHWQQRYVRLNTQKELEFCFKDIAPKDLPDDLKSGDWKNNEIVEINSNAVNIMKKIVKHLKFVFGAGLIIDYGYVTGQGDSLQAISYHKHVDILDKIGEIDLTTHVNFGQLQKMAGSSGKTMTQRDFLFKYGLLNLAQNYGRKTDVKTRHQIEQQVYKLTSSQEMGTLFKVLELNFSSHKSHKDA